VWCCTVSQPFAPTEHARCTSPIRRSNGSRRSRETGGSMDRTVAKPTRIRLTLIRQELVVGHCWGHSIACPACGQTVQLFELNSNRFGPTQSEMLPTLSARSDRNCSGSSLPLFSIARRLTPGSANVRETMRTLMNRFPSCGHVRKC
jgi:hypothetical protein